MLKRSGTLLLTTLYLVTALGFALNLHYCFNTLSSVKFDAPSKACSSHAAAKMKCCTDKLVDVKIKDAHQGEAASFLLKAYNFQLPGLHFGNFLSAQKASSKKLFNRIIPENPLDHILSFLKNCIFRI
jgi:hypothetical protein